LKEIWTQVKVYILVGTLLGLNILHTTYSNTGTGSKLGYKQHILSPAKVRKICYSVAGTMYKSLGTSGLDPSCTEGQISDPPEAGREEGRQVL
jgi:hypothetical protein